MPLCDLSRREMKQDIRMSGQDVANIDIDVVSPVIALRRSNSWST